MGIGDRVREAREAAGISQAAVGNALGLSASQISRAESGKRQISAYELGVLSEAFGWDVRALLGIERPRTKMAVAARLRSEEGDPSGALRRAADLVEVDNLLDAVLSSDSSRGLEHSRPAPEPTNREQAILEGEKAAEDLREGLGVSGPVPDLLGLCEQDLGVDVLVASFDGDCDGAIAITDSLTIIVVNADMISGRQRFTIAHELAHGIFGDVSDTLLLDFHRHGLVEERAHAFASALLMPAGELRRILGSDPDVTQLAEAMVHFGVSWKALRKRCARVDIKVDDALLELDGREVFTKAGRGEEVESLEASMPTRAPSRLIRRVRAAYGDALVGAGVVGMALGLTGEELELALQSIPVEFEIPAPSGAI
jgi:Zn-dependent peptidase ImmA (M78 family)/transcriptional regulator with XRE-family HTH domain